MNDSASSLLGLKDLLSDARHGTAERKVRAGFLFALACLLIAGTLFSLSVQRLRSNAAWLDHTHQVLTHLDRLLALATDAETAERGYVITGDEDSLTAYTKSETALGPVERELQQLLADNPAQQSRLQHLTELVNDRMAVLHAVDEARRIDGFAAAQELIRNGLGERIHSQLRAQMDELADAERALLRERQRRADRSTLITFLLGVGSSLLALYCVAWAARISRRDLAERRRVEAEREALRERLAVQLDDMRRLHGLSSKLAEIKDLHEMLDKVLEATIEIQHADFGNIQLYDQRTESLRIVAQRGFSADFLEHFRSVGARAPSVCGRALQRRARVVVEDVANDAEFAPHLTAASQAGFRGVQSTPIFGREGAIIGMLSTHFRRPHRPSDHDLQITDLYMHTAAALIERAQDMEAVRGARDRADRANEELRHLQSITDTALSSEGTEALIRALLARLRAALRSDTTTILLTDADGRHLTPFASDGLEAEVGGEVQIPIGRGVAGRIALGEGPVIFEDLSQVDVVSPILRSQVRSIIGVPLKRGGRLIGVVHAGSSTLRTFSKDDARLLSLAADRIGTAIERARYHEAEQVARRAAETAERQKGSFLATASHDLRQPLQTLSLLNGALSRIIKDELAARALSEQEVAIGVMSRLLNALLDISKLESGAVKPELTIWSITALFEQLRSEFASAAANKGLQLQVQSAGAWVHSDQSLIGQLLRNLLTNAIKYTKQGHVLLRSRTGDGWVNVDVIDTGIGMASQELMHIYDDFYQIGVSANTAREGYGLGLSIVSRILKLLGLEIDVQSELGKGSTFSLKLPSAAAPPLTTAPAADTARPAKRESPGHCVLVVEDDVAVLNATRMLLAAEGYRVVTAGSVAQALARILETPDVELVITDYHLADGETGRQVISAIRETRGSRFKAVMITADTSRTARALEDDEALRFLSKPVNPSDLVEVLEELVGKS